MERITVPDAGLTEGKGPVFFTGELLSECFDGDWKLYQTPDDLYIAVTKDTDGEILVTNKLTAQEVLEKFPQLAEAAGFVDLDTGDNKELLPEE